MLFDRIIRAWKDPEYRLSLSEEEQALLPENPAGAIELTDDELEMAVGGHSPSHNSSNSSARSASNSARSAGNSARSASNSARSASNSARNSSNKSWRRPPQSQSNSGRPRRARRPVR